MNSAESFKSLFTPFKAVFFESRGLQFLTGLLALQLLVSGGLLWRSSVAPEFTPSGQLIAFDPDSINEITIDDGDASVTVSMQDNQWVLDDEHATVAASDKVESLIASVSDLSAGLPVANTTASHPQLKVADDDYERRLVFKAGSDTVADFYVGTSPGFRKAHARLVEQDSVYSVRLNTFDVPTEKGDWLDGTLLSFTDVSGIASGDVEIVQADDQWTIVEPQAQLVSHEVDSEKAESLVGALQSMRVTDFAEPLVAEEGSDEELLTQVLTIVGDDADTPVTLQLSKLGNAATATRSDIEGVFSTSVATFDALDADALQQLIVETTSEGDPDDDTDLPNG